jgi:hypothetical protein
VKQQLAAMRMLFDWLINRADRTDELGGGGARAQARL